MTPPRPRCRQVALVALLGVVALAGGAVAAISANRVVYRDSVREGADAPDITAVTVSNDDLGLVTFGIAIPNRPKLDGKMRVDVYIDADGNRTNGAGKDFGGAEYALDLIPDDGLALGRWVKGRWSYGGAQPASLASSYRSGAVIQVNAFDLGLRRFGFYAFADDDRDVTGSGTDLAPDAGRDLYPYEVKAPLPPCRPGQTSTPARPCRR